MWYKGYEITKGQFVYKWYLWKDDEFIATYWSKEDAQDAVDRLTDACIVGTKG